MPSRAPQTRTKTPVWLGIREQFRTARLLHTAALRLRKHTSRLGSFGAWNRCLNHLLTLAESHIETVVLSKFNDAIARYLPFTNFPFSV